MADYMEHKQECLWVCQNTHWVINSTEKAIMKFQHENTLFSLLPSYWIRTPYPEAVQLFSVYQLMTTQDLCNVLL